MQRDLFEKNSEVTEGNQPLAARMAPASIEEFFGQEAILGPGKMLRRAIEAGRMGSVIFFGPPGTGKTALARIIARRVKAHYEEANAVVIGISDIRKITDQARIRLAAQGVRTLLLLDEIHHFNKTQQDALLPDVEKGLITLIGITTENPYFYVNRALLSRSTLFQFNALGEAALRSIITRAVTDPVRGFGKLKIEITEDAAAHLVNHSSGDARRLLNALEIGVLTTSPAADGAVHFDRSVAEESLQKKALSYDKSGDEHYDHISAFIKSMRGSDPDAALYWMSRMIAAGEDPRFIARRIIICASEDVGNADPHALMIATAALQAVDFVGMPEGRIPLAQAAVYVACAPKSNAAYLAVDSALAEVSEGKPRPVPLHLRDATGDKALGHGKGYRYPHDFPGHFVPQEYWPDPKQFYRPTDQGYEVKISERLAHWRKQKGTAPAPQKAKG